MRNLIVFDALTIDGFFAGINGEIDWHHTDAEFNDFAINQLQTFDTILFGRTTYEMMAGYWPTKEGIADDPIVAGMMNTILKIVFSHTLTKTDWQNSTISHRDVMKEVMHLKSFPGKDIAIFGSGSLVSALAGLGVIDEYRLLIHPVVLRNGKSLFGSSGQSFTLTLADERVFGNGNVLLTYRETK